MATTNLTLRIDREYLELMVYREVLREIVSQAARDPFGYQGVDAAAVARYALGLYGRLPPEAA